MRRHNPGDFLKGSSSRRSYNDERRSKSPRKSHRDRYPVVDSDSSRRSLKNRFRTLCVRHFSNLPIDGVQSRLFREFSRFGDVSVSVGYLDGEKAALIVFQHEEDAHEAYRALPLVRVGDHTLTVEALPESVPGTETADLLSGSRSSRLHTSHNTAKPARVDAETNDFFNADPPLGAPSLLGLPVSTPNMAAAMALKLASTSALLAPPRGQFGQDFRTRHAYDQRESSPLHEDDPVVSATRTLFIGHLEPDIKESEVIRAFESFGSIEQVDVKRPLRTGAHSYAFVRYDNVSMAYRARTAMMGKRIRTYHCKIGFGKAITSRCLFISSSALRSGQERISRALARLDQVVCYDWSSDQENVTVSFSTVDAAINAHRLLKKICSTDPEKAGLLVDFVNDPTEDDNTAVEQLSKSEATNRNIKYKNEDSCSTQDVVVTLQNAIQLGDLDKALQPELCKGTIHLKSSGFHFRCLHVIGDQSLSTQVSQLSPALSCPVFRVVKRGVVDPTWMAEATYVFRMALSDRQGRVALLLLLPDFQQHDPSISQKNTCTMTTCYPLAVLVAYLKVKQSLAVVVPETETTTGDSAGAENSGILLNLFAPSSFSLSLLKQAAPRLCSDLATSGNYALLLATKS